MDRCQTGPTDFREEFARLARVMHDRARRAVDPVVRWIRSPAGSSGCRPGKKASWQP